ncbi:MAG TPA: hypothetical protein VFL49_01760 [Pseudolabrys sp.]|nr:hypothetical protein [Pseudolabrys sp.]
METLKEAKVFGLSYDDACARALPGSMEAYHLWLKNLHDPRGEAATLQACETD